MKSVALFAAIFAVAAPIPAAADFLDWPWMFPSPLVGYLSEDGHVVPIINVNAGGSLQSVTLHAAANATWSGGASTDMNEATYTVTVGAFDFTMVAEKEGPGSAGALANITVPTADFAEFVGGDSASTSVSVSNSGGTAAFITSTFPNTTVSYVYTPGQPSPGVSGCSFTEVDNMCPVSPVSTSGSPPTTPLPAALPLFATGLGALGLLGWRRKRKARASLLGVA